MITIVTNIITIHNCHKYDQDCHRGIIETNAHSCLTACGEEKHCKRDRSSDLVDNNVILLILVRIAENQAKDISPHLVFEPLLSQSVDRRLLFTGSKALLLTVVQRFQAVVCLETVSILFHYFVSLSLRFRSLSQLQLLSCLVSGD